MIHFRIQLDADAVLSALELLNEFPPYAPGCTIFSGSLTVPFIPNM